MDLSKADEFAALDLLGNAGAAFIIVYLLARHVLLLRGELLKDDYLCGDCSKACVKSLKRPSTAEPIYSRGRNTSIIENASNHIYVNVIFYCTIGCLLSYIGYALNAAIHDMTLMNWLPFGYCRFAIPIGGVLFISAKSNLYGVLAARLHLGFHTSAVGYSTRLIHTLLAAVCMYWLCLCLTAAVFSRGKRHKAKNASHKICKILTPQPYVATLALFDFCFSIAVAYMFISALRKLLAARRKSLGQREKMSRFKGQKEQAAFYSLIQKYTILCTVAILSTLLTLVLVALFKAGFLIAIDAVVNCMLLLFMTGKWQPVYDKVCGPLIRCVVKTPCLPCADLTNGVVERAIEAPQITPSLLSPAKSEAPTT